MSGPKVRLLPEKATLSLIGFSAIFDCVDREPFGVFIESKATGFEQFVFL